MVDFLDELAGGEVLVMFLEHLDEGIEVGVEGLGLGDLEGFDIRSDYLGLACLFAHI